MTTHQQQTHESFGFKWRQRQSYVSEEQLEFTRNWLMAVFWNDAFTFEETLHVNFDWYHPRYAHRQSEDEVCAWSADLGLAITHMDVQASGITVRAARS